MRSETVAPPPEPSRDGSPLVSIQDLKTYYSIRGSFLDRLAGREAGIVRAVDEVSIDIRRGEVLGLVGESGSGKTTLGRTLLGLVKCDRREHAVRRARRSAAVREREWRDLCRQIQVVFQDPHASLNPAMTIEQAVGHPLQIHGLVRNRERNSGSCHRGARALRPRSGRRLPRQVPVGSLGWSEAAGRDRAGDHPQPRAARRGRARLDAGHERPREDPRADDRAQARPRVHVSSTSRTTSRPRASSATGSRSCTSGRSSRSARRRRSTPIRSTRTPRRCSGRYRSPTLSDRCPETSREARFRTPRCRRSAVPSIRAARAHSSRAAGSLATCASCWSHAGLLPREHPA